MAVGDSRNCGELPDRSDAYRKENVAAVWELTAPENLEIGACAHTRHQDLQVRAITAARYADQKSRILASILPSS